MVAATATSKDDAKKAKKEAEDMAKAEEAEKHREYVEQRFEMLLQRIAIMERIVDKQEELITKMDNCEEHISNIENKEWVDFVRMGIVGCGDGDAGTMYADEEKRKEKEREKEAAKFKAEILAGAKAPAGRPPTGFKPHHANRHRKYVNPAARKPPSVPEMTMVYDPETQSVKLILWEEYLKTNKPPCPQYVAVYREDVQEVELMFWNQYVALGLQDADLAARKNRK